MKATHETLIIVGTAAGVFFGSLAGGMTGYLAAMTAHPATPTSSLQVDDHASINIVQSSLPSVVSIQIQQQDDTGQFVDTGGGTGFFVSSDGLILTNKHVVSDDTAHYVVVTNDDKRHDAKVLAKDPFLDLAVVKIDGTGFPVLSLGNSDAVQIGESVMAIGNSLSEFPNSVTKGIISGVNRTISAGDAYGDQEVIEEAIQTDAAISEGNSGGPLIDLNGQVVGVDTAVSAEGQSLGFAIPINVAKKIVSDVETYGRVIRPWLGVHFVMIDPTIAGSYKLSIDQGALVLPDEKGQPASVVAGSPADKAGIKAGDIITSVNNVMLDDHTSLSQAIGAFKPGDVVTIVLLRNNASMTVQVTLQELTPGQL